MCTNQASYADRYMYIRGNMEVAKSRSLTHCLAFKYLLMRAWYSRPAKTSRDKYTLVCILAFSCHNF